MGRPAKLKGPSAAVARCPRSGTDALHVRCHDEEWEGQLRDEHRRFEFPVVEGAQAGLCWITILGNRETYRRARKGFDPGRLGPIGRAAKGCRSRARSRQRQLVDAFAGASTGQR